MRYIMFSLLCADQAVEKNVGLLVIWDALALMQRHT